ncbi:hypothetical protein C0J52_01298 [Blattella germanica]|nr:hypothetical protein C0J52_01298 [Blattella germanica]
MFYKNNDSLEAAQREFRRFYNLGRHGVVPSKHAIKGWINNFEETGSALKKKPTGRPRSARTPQNIDVVRESQSAAVGMSRESVRRILRLDLKFHPYKLQMVQELKENDYQLRLGFCQEMITKINNDDEFLNKLWMSDEAHFHLTGYVNKQNYRYWADTNPNEVHERPLHASKVTLWCAVSSHGIIGPHFFANEQGNTITVNSDRYVEMLRTFVTPELNNFQHVQEYWFQQDGATSHTAWQSMEVVRELFGNHVISRFGNIPWPPRSPDLSVCDFFLWGYLKSKVYTTRPRTLDELKQRIRDEIHSIPAEMLQRSMKKVLRFQLL